MTALKLTLKKKWFEMILSGEKTEEYREIKPYWTTRLHSMKCSTVFFRNGYGPTMPAMEVILKGIYTGYGKPEWGAPKNERVYILKLGAVIQTINCDAQPTTQEHP